MSLQRNTVEQRRYDNNLMSDEVTKRTDMTDYNVQFSHRLTTVEMPVNNYITRQDIYRFRVFPNKELLNKF